MEDALGVEDRAGVSRVDALIGEHGFDGVGAHRVVAFGDSLVQIDESDALVFGDLASPGGVAVGGALDGAFFPFLPRDEGAEDRGSSLAADFFDELANVGAERFDGFGFAVF